MPYLSGDYPCPFNPDKAAAPKNLRELPPVIRHEARVIPDPGANSPEVMSSAGLEDLL